MSVNRINGGNSIRVSNEQMHSRQTPRNDFSSMIARGASNGANALATAAGVSAPYVPGASVVNATMSQAANAMNPDSGNVGNYSAGGTMNVPGQGPGTQSQTGQASTGNAQQDLMNQTKKLQEMQQSFNLQYLALQEKMQGENRQFSTISNVLKTKHDTAKNAINNVR
jgi:hypothetical protein